MRLAKIFFLFATLFSCNHPESDKTLNNVAETSKTNEDLPIYIAQVNELRMREKPDITSKVLYVIKEQEEVFYLNEKTNFTETIKLRGVDYTEP